MKSKSYLPYILAGAAGSLVTAFLPLVINSSQADTKLLPFQGRLTDAAGAAIADGAKVVEFKMYDAPTGGNVKWAGEVHKLSVNGGLVNTMLGSKAGLGSVDFAAPSFLQITVDANGDGAITAADPPLLPRQSVVGAVYAAVAGQMQYRVDVNTVASADWSAVFNNGRPDTGKILGGRLADNSVTAKQLAEDAVETAEIKDFAITAAKLAPGAASGALALDSITSDKLKDGLAVGTADLTPELEARLGQIAGRLDALESGLWTPIPNPTPIGTVPWTSTGEQPLGDLSNIIPASAKQVLVYGWVYTGGGQPDFEGACHIYTKSGGTQFGHRLHARTFQGGGSVAYNSSTFWLPVTLDRTIYGRNLSTVTLTGAGGLISQLLVLGYK